MYEYSCGNIRIEIEVDLSLYVFIPPSNGAVPDIFRTPLVPPNISRYLSGWRRCRVGSAPVDPSD